MAAPAPALVNDYSPRYVGDTSGPLKYQFVDYARPVPQVYDLTGVNMANMTFHMKPHGGGAVKVGLGTWTTNVQDALNGVASYAWNTNDVNTSGEWDIQAGVPFSDGLKHFSIMTIEFLDPL